MKVNNYYDKIFKEVSEETGIPYNQVRLAYKYFWKFIKNTFISFPLKNNLTKEEFEKLRCSFNVPYLGKIGCSWDRYKKITEKYGNKNKGN